MGFVAKAARCSYLTEATNNKDGVGTVSGGGVTNKERKVVIMCPNGQLTEFT